MASLILIGGGGHCESCIDVIEQQGKYQIAGIVDQPKKIGQTVVGYKIIAGDEDLARLAGEYEYFMITIGHIKTPEKRMHFFATLQSLAVKLPVIISPYAYVSKYANIGRGSIIHHHAMVNANAKIGINCIINSKALVEHGSRICDHVHISTGAIVNGEAQVGNGSFIGSGSVVREAITIGDNCIVGSGLIVTASLTSRTLMKPSF